MVSPYQNSKLKIQMLAGNSLNVCPDSDSQKKLPLDINWHNKSLLHICVPGCTRREKGRTRVFIPII